MPSIKKNFTYSTILTLAGYIFPLITYPYVSRVLGVSNVGICNFVDSIISYFSMFAAMGISITGIREIAAVGNDKKKRSNVFSSLVSLYGITTLLSSFALIVCIQVIPLFNENKDLMYVGLMKLISNFLLIEWFYKGIEEFKYITCRTLLVRMIYVISVFFVVKDADDYGKYFFLTNVTLVVNAIINIAHSRKFVCFSFKGISFKPFIVSFLIMGLYNIVSSLYTTFNTAYLGMVSTSTEVGFYTTAHKMYMLVIAIYTAFTGVMLPRMSSLISEGKMDEFKVYILKSVDILLSFAIPIVVYTAVFSEEIIRLLSGPGYEGAVLPMKIVMPLVLIIGYEQILVIQVLMPLKKDKIVFINSAIGAIVGLFLNFIIVKQLGAVGSSLVWLCCEIVVLISAQIFVNKYVNIGFPVLNILKNMLAYAPGFLTCVLIHQLSLNFVLTLVIGSLVVVLNFIIVQFFIFKNSLALSALKNAVNLFKHHK